MNNGIRIDEPHEKLISQNKVLRQFNTSRQTLYRKVQSLELVAFKLPSDKQIYFSLKQINWLLGHKRKRK